MPRRQLQLALLLTVLLQAANVGWVLAQTPTLSPLPPAKLGMSREQLARIDGVIEQGIEDGKIPGAVVVVGRQKGIAYAKAFGNRRLEPSKEEMTLNTVFDLASLTKPIATATSIMILVERGQVSLREPVAAYLTEFGQNGKESITVEQLLTHQGGLIPDNALADYQDGIDKAWRNIWKLEPTDALGKRFVYTDVGFLVLAKIVEKVSGQTIAQFAAENIYQPLGMTETGYVPADDLRERAATTEQREGRWMKGEVHDPRAYLLEGVAGHAGLFSTAYDLSLYARTLLAGGTRNGQRILGQATLQEMTSPRDIAGQLRGLGWDMRSKYSSNRGELLSQQAFGHGGFTGTAIWIDPKLDLFYIVLSNRVHPDGKGSVNPLAGRIGTIAAASIVGIRRPPATTSKAAGGLDVLTGIDVLEREKFQSLTGARIGLITNHTGVNREGKRTVDLFHASEQVELVAIFSPEHGLQGKLDQANIDHTTDQATGLPVYSLYGESRKPSGDQLQGIDTLVFDIQDIGTRFYTYISTMGLAMEAAAEQGIRFVVLDRPNPLNGLIVEGPLLDEDKESFVAYHRMPVRHGMTIGELAKMFQTERNLELDLQIVKVQGWKRNAYWDQTGLTWVNPSPNMRSLNQAVLYPGVGLLEATNVSVGRGTDTPFEVLGAPWIEERELAKHLNGIGLPGVRFVPIRFTPTSSKHKEKECGGVNITVTNRRAFRAFPVGLHLAAALKQLYPDDWDTKRMNHLLRSDEVLAVIEQGKSLAECEAKCQRQSNQFKNKRQLYLLYR